MTISTTDLFAGAGGASLGFHAVTDNVLGFEWDDDAVATQWAAGMSVCRADLSRLMPVGVLGGHHHLHASPPCTTFSIAGKGKGREHLDTLGVAVRDILTGGETDVDLSDIDEVTLLTLVPARWIAATMPDTISFEQVRQVLPLWEAYADGLEALGYDVWTGLIHAEQYGVPQTRTRAWLTASRVGTDPTPPPPTHSRYHSRNPSKLDEGVLPWVSMADALGLAEGGVGFRRRNDRDDGNEYRARDLRDVEAPAFGLTEKARSWTHLRPSTTVNGDPRLSGPGRNDPDVSGSQYGPNSRRITIEEAAVLQGFPADYPWQGTKTSAFRQCGNAVCPPIAEAILRELVKQ